MRIGNHTGISMAKVKLYLNFMVKFHLRFCRDDGGVRYSVLVLIRAP